MKSAPQVNREQVYVTDFKTPVLVGLFIWLLLIAAPAAYFWIKGMDIVNEFQKSQNEILLLTVAVAGLLVVMPVLGWQRVVVIDWENKLIYRNVLDLIRSRTREFKLNEMISVKTKRRPKIGTVLKLEFKDGSVQKINKSNLKHGTELEHYLRTKLDSS